jgi:hypothetical protein
MVINSKFHKRLHYSSKRIIHISLLLLITNCVHAQIDLPKQPKCGCPLITLGVYDTNINFTADSAVEKGNYAQAQKSGDHLESTYEKQQSDQLKVMRVPKQGTSTQIDFKTNAEIDRSGSAGSYTYDVIVKITDAYTQATVKNKKETTSSLGNAYDMIDSCVASFSPVLDSAIRNYQKKIRKQSNYTKWIGLQWQAKPDSKNLKKNNATPVTITVTDCIDKKPVTKLPIHISQTDPNTGILSASTANTNDSGKVAVIFTARNKGETLILPSFSYTNVNGKKITDPTVCADQKITVDEDFPYKIMMDAEYTVDGTGRDIKLHGECISSLKQLGDGTYILEPTDKTRNMNITVQKADAVNSDGANGKLITPLQYTIPYLFTVGKMDKQLSEGHAIVYLNTTSPESGQVQWLYTTPGGSLTTTYDIDNGTIINTPPGQTIQVVPKGSNTMFAMDALTGLDILSNLMADQNIATQNSNQNIANSQDQMDFAKRLQAHMNDPAYFKTAQGKADLQRMQSFNQQVGGNMVNSSSTTKNIGADIAKKIKDNPGYAGSAQFQKDIGKSEMSRVADKSIYQKDAMAQVTPGTAKVRIEGNFEPNSMDAFTGNLESSIGPMKIIVKITVEKVEQ